MLTTSSLLTLHSTTQRPLTRHCRPGGTHSTGSSQTAHCHRHGGTQPRSYTVTSKYFFHLFHYTIYLHQIPCLIFHTFFHYFHPPILSCHMRLSHNSFSQLTFDCCVLFHIQVYPYISVGRRILFINLSLPPCTYSFLIILVSDTMTHPSFTALIFLLASLFTCIALLPNT